MSTFRNSQIEEILNNERNMNRVILDRVSAHIASIGDDKAPPTTRDIKIEAQIGGLIDGLKETINKAIQKISGYQYGKATEKNTARNLKLPTNNMGEQTANIPGAPTGPDEGPDVEDEEYSDEEEKELVKEMKNILNSSGDIA